MGIPLNLFRRWHRWRVGNLHREAVNERIVALSGGVDIIQYDECFRSARQTFEESKEEVSSILVAFLAAQDDEYLAQLRTKVEEQKIFSRESILKSMIATGDIATRDPQANARIQSAPHQGVLATIWAIRSAFDACNELSKVADRAARHIDRMSSPQTRVIQQLARMSSSVMDAPCCGIS
jgi:hypothetical protein